MTRSAPLSSLWLGVWAGFLSLGWLLTNHYLPWPNFHSDLYIAAVMLLAAWAVARSAKIVTWSWLSLGAAAIVVIPPAQYFLGLLTFAGQAWIAAAYLLGFALAVLIGYQWEQLAPGQGGTGLLCAIAIAAIASVGIQLYQWLIADHGNTVWLLPAAAYRPYGNFAQPNQLATFLLWGLVACAWGAERGKIGRPVAILLAAYLLFGIALTQSRTAMVAIGAITIASWVWRPLRQTRSIAWTVTGLAIFFAFCLVSIGWLNEVLLLNVDLGDLIAKTRHEVRITAYKIFMRAVLHSPWWGYGWSETARAQLSVADAGPGLGGFFFHAHNLFLDLLLWCGIPLGGGMVALLVAWYISKVRQARDIPEALMLIFVGVVVWHAMTELPLHYASFLLPTGLVMGMLDAHRASSVLRTGRAVLVFAMLGAGALLGVLTRDYLEIEANFYALRFERAGLSEKPPLGPPDVMVLTQMREYIRSMRMEIRPGMSAQDIQLLRELADSFPSEASIVNLMMALTLNNGVEEARTWLAKVPRITSAEGYDHLRKVWLYESKKNPGLLKLEWPQWKQ